MKFLGVFVILALAACEGIQAELSKEEAIAIATACKDEAGASDADFEAMVKHQSVETKEGKCMRACTLKKFGVMSDEGNIIKDVALEISKDILKDDDKKELVAEVVDACDDLEVREDHCEAAEEYAECLIHGFESKGFSSAEDFV